MEGPSIVILKEELRKFKRKKILKVTGNSKVDIVRMKGQVVLDFKSWGKHFLICFNNFYLRIHFLMFGSYRIDEKKNAAERLALHFKHGIIYFYSCSVKVFDGNPDEMYDWEADVMNDDWNESKAIKKLKQQPDTLICDALLDQTIFAGVGNIIRNEVLFRARLHPETKIKSLAPALLRLVVREARNYSFDFLKWKKIFQLRKHWLVYTKRKCPNCGGRVIKKYPGSTKRRIFFCPNCQLKKQ